MGSGQVNSRYAKSIDLKSTQDYQENKSYSSQDSVAEFKIAVVGVKTAVGKTALIYSLINQKPCIYNIPQTLGVEVKTTRWKNKKIQFWEFDQDWENRLNDSFSAVILVFDDFDIQLIVYQMKRLQQIVEFAPIHLVGNDRLNMSITGKEEELRKEVKTSVHILDLNNQRDLQQLIGKLI
ncbi:hypothetical protein pb186bvf_011469 [Paramecium bursaria]